LIDTASIYGNEFDVFDLQLKDEDLSYIDAFNENLRVVDDPMTLW